MRAFQLLFVWGLVSWATPNPVLAASNPEEHTTAKVDNSKNQGGKEKSTKGERDKKKGDKEKKPEKKVEFTGSYRLRYESQQNFDLVYDRNGLTPKRADNDDNFLLSQLRLNLDLKPNKYVHAHFTFQDSREFFSHQIDSDQLDRVYRNTYENQTDIYEAWVKLRLGDCPVWVQAGRQELIYGDKRLLGNSVWPNTGRTFDALRLLYEKGDIKLDLIAANRVLVDSNAWDHADHHDNLLGAYATVKNLPQGLQDVYLFYRDNDVSRLEEYTLGTRIKGDKDCLDWNLEGAYQWGSSLDTVAPNRRKVSLDQKAWAAHAEFGHTQKNHPLKPRLALEYNYATGDKDPIDGKNNTFDQLFPNNHSWLGFMDLHSWKNIHSPAVKLSWNQTKNFKFNVDWTLFWLDQERTDAWYNSGQRVFRNSTGNPASSFAGQELDLRATYKVSEKVDLELGYGHYFAGQYAADTAPVGGGADDADMVYIQTSWRF